MRKYYENFEKKLISFKYLLKFWQKFKSFLRKFYINFVNHQDIWIVRYKIARILYRTSHWKLEKTNRTGAWGYRIESKEDHIDCWSRTESELHRGWSHTHTALNCTCEEIHVNVATLASSSTLTLVSILGHMHTCHSLTSKILLFSVIVFVA